MLNRKELFGLTHHHIDLDWQLHYQVVPDYLRLKSLCSENGFELEIYSGFRSYEKQLSIWNAKAQGKRALLRDDGHALDYSQLEPIDILQAMMRWSAIPGFSRHHWGTDFDIYDGRTQKRAEVTLTPQETEGAGPAASLHNFLDQHLEKFGFFRPYQKDHGGVAPERWHISHRKVANTFFYDLSLNIFKDFLAEKKEEIELSSLLLRDPQKYYLQYVTNCLT